MNGQLFPNSPSPPSSTSPACGGRGFDVILGTASGDMLHESVKLDAPLGTYIDVGRVDAQNSMSIGLEPFQKCATFTSFGIKDVVDADPEIGRGLLKSVDSYYRKGLISPILRTYDSFGYLNPRPNSAWVLQMHSYWETSYHLPTIRRAY